MARADLLCELIKNGLLSDDANFRKVAEAICAEERAKQHEVLAQKIEEILKANSKPRSRDSGVMPINNLNNGNGNGASLFQEKVPAKRLDQLILPNIALQSCKDLIEEQLRSDILRSHGVEPRNRMLLIGPPGNGKTSLAEAIAESLMVPLLTVKYESIIGAYLGETASKLAKLFDYVKTRQCVVFFDEFETLGKERGDQHETGEIKRVVSSLLLQIDALPSYVVVIAATNHEILLDKAAWRRFQLKLELIKPDKRNIEIWLSQFEKRNSFSFGLTLDVLAKKLSGISFAEVEDFALSVFRKHILQCPDKMSKQIALEQLKLLGYENSKSDKDENGGNN